MLSSPFPGIDPYIKAQGSCRTSTPASSRICAMRWLISCPFNYEARIDERLNLVELPAEKLRRIKPDLAVSRGELSRGPFRYAIPLKHCDLRESVIAISAQPGLSSVS